MANYDYTTTRGERAWSLEGLFAKRWDQESATA